MTEAWRLLWTLIPLTRHFPISASKQRDFTTFRSDITLTDWRKPEVARWLSLSRSVSVAWRPRRLDRHRGCSHESRDNGQWSSNVTEDGLDRHAATGDF